MSVSIYISNVEWVERPVKCWVCWQGEGQDSCQKCEGSGVLTESVPEVDTVDMANESWRLLIRQVGLPVYNDRVWAGSIWAEEVPKWRRLILRYKWLSKCVQGEAWVAGAAPRPRVQQPGKCRVVQKPYTYSRLLRHVNALERALKTASERGEGIYWG